MCRLDDLRKEKSRLLENLGNFSNILKDNDGRSHSDHMAGGMATRAEGELNLAVFSSHANNRLRIIDEAIADEIKKPTIEGQTVPCINGERCEGNGVIASERIALVPWTKVCGPCAIAAEKAAQKR